MLLWLLFSCLKGNRMKKKVVDEVRIRNLEIKLKHIVHKNQDYYINHVHDIQEYYRNLYCELEMKVFSLEDQVKALKRKALKK